MKDIGDIRALVTDNPEMQIIILDLDDCILGTKPDGSHYIINESKLAAMLKDKIVCFITDKGASGLPKVVIDFIENNNLLHAPELFFSSNSRGRLWTQAKDSIAEQPLLQQLADGELTPDELAIIFEKAFLHLATIPIGDCLTKEIRIKGRQISAAFIDDTMKKVMIRLIKATVDNGKMDQVDLVFSTYLTFYQGLSGVDGAIVDMSLDKHRLSQLYNSLRSLMHSYVAAGNLEAGNAIFKQMKSLLAYAKKSQELDETLNHLEHINDMLLSMGSSELSDEFFAGLASETIKPLVQQEIFAYLLQEMFVQQRSKEEFAKLFSWYVTTMVKLSGLGIDSSQQHVKTLMNTFANAYQLIQSSIREFSASHPMLSLAHDFLDTVKNNIELVKMDDKSKASASASSAVSKLILNKAVVEQLYRTLDIDREAALRGFLRGFEPSLSSADASSSAAASSSQVRLTEQDYQRLFDRGIDSLRASVTQFKLYDDGHCDVSFIYSNEAPYWAMSYSLTFSDLAEYQNFVDGEKSLGFLWCMAQLGVLPRNYAAALGKYSVMDDEGEIEPQTRVMKFFDDKQGFCAQADRMGISARHADTTPALQSTQKYLDIIKKQTERRNPDWEYLSSLIHDLQGPSPRWFIRLLTPLMDAINNKDTKKINYHLDILKNVLQNPPQDTYLTTVSPAKINNTVESLVIAGAINLDSDELNSLCDDITSAINRLRNVVSGDGKLSIPIPRTILPGFKIRKFDVAELVPLIKQLIAIDVQHSLPHNINHEVMGQLIAKVKVMYNHAAELQVRSFLDNLRSNLIKLQNAYYPFSEAYITAINSPAAAITPCQLKDLFDSKLSELGSVVKVFQDKAFLRELHKRINHEINLKGPKDEHQSRLWQIEKVDSLLNILTGEGFWYWIKQKEVLEIDYFNNLARIANNLAAARKPVIGGAGRLMKYAQEEESASRSTATKHSPPTLGGKK